MNSSRKKISLKMSARDATDSKHLLVFIADLCRDRPELFEDRDIEVKVKVDSNSTENSVLSTEAAACASDALELQNQAIKSGMAKVESPKETKSKIAEFMEICRQESIRVSVRTLMSGLIDRMTDFI